MFECQPFVESPHCKEQIGKFFNSPGCSIADAKLSAHNRRVSVSGKVMNVSIFRDGVGLQVNLWGAN